MLDAHEVKAKSGTTVIITRQPTPKGVQASAQCREGLYSTGLETVFVANLHVVLEGQAGKLPFRESGQPTEKKMFSLGLRYLLQFHLGDGSNVLFTFGDLTLENTPRVACEATQPLPEFAQDIHVASYTQ